MELIQRMIVTHDMIENVRNQYGPDATNQMIITELATKLAHSLISASQVSITNITNPMTFQTEVELRLNIPNTFVNYPYT
jgi:hypothetical protein